MGLEEGIKFEGLPFLHQLPSTKDDDIVRSEHERCFFDGRQRRNSRNEPEVLRSEAAELCP